MESTSVIRVVNKLNSQFSSSGLLLYFQISETTERINIEKLKAHERIHFFQDLLLFEDELGDNGDSNMNVKVVRIESLLGSACEKIRLTLKVLNM